MQLSSIKFANKQEASIAVSPRQYEEDAHTYARNAEEVFVHMEMQTTQPDCEG